jgi:hypothetical protein
MLEWDREKFKKMFPNIFHELEGSKLPTVIDHLERCRNKSEALEIIDYFEKTGEITHEFASFLRANLGALSSLFGTRERGDYERRGLID